jgi:hypothetical protein
VARLTMARSRVGNGPAVTLSGEKPTGAGEHPPGQLWRSLALGTHASLTVSAPDHPAEQEADRVADGVMRTTGTPSPWPGEPGAAGATGPPGSGAPLEPGHRPLGGPLAGCCDSPRREPDRCRRSGRQTALRPPGGRPLPAARHGSRHHPAGIGGARPRSPCRGRRRDRAPHHTGHPRLVADGQATLARVAGADDGLGGLLMTDTGKAESERS